MQTKVGAANLQLLPFASGAYGKDNSAMTSSAVDVLFDLGDESTAEKQQVKKKDMMYKS